MVESVKLATGANLPLLGLGTWLSSDPSSLDTALRVALDVGYRYIDTAYVYGNEAVIGKVLHEYISSGKIKREDLFITTKLPFLAFSSEEVEPMIDGQLKDLQLDYIDLYLMHVACPCKHQEGNSHGNYHALLVDGQLVPDLIDHISTWKAMEKIFKEGKAKAIGLSNFNEDQIQRILDNCTIPPHNLQVECYIYWPQTKLVEFCKKYSITFTAYGPLGSPGRKSFRPDGTWPDAEPMKDPAVRDLAKKYGKTPAQILLRHTIQRGISAIPKSTNANRVKENFNIFDFKLTDDEMNVLNSVEPRIRLFVFDFFANHPYYPFFDVDRSKLKKVHLTEF